MRSEKQKRLRDLKDNLIPQASEKIRTLQRELSSMEKEASELVTYLAPKSSKGVKLSDHALIRYLERRHKFDLEPFRREILTPDRIAAIEMGAKTITANGVSFKVDGKTIITAI